MSGRGRGVLGLRALLWLSGSRGMPGAGAGMTFVIIVLCRPFGAPGVGMGMHSAKTSS